MGICLPWRQCFCHHHHLCTYWIPIHCHRIPHNIVLTKELISQQKEWGNGLRPKGFARSSWHYRMVRMAIKDTVWVTTARQRWCLAKWGCSSTKCSIYSESAIKMHGAFLVFFHPTAYIGAESKGKTGGQLSLLLYLIIYLQSFASALVRFRGLSSQRRHNIVQFELKIEACIRPFCVFSSHWTRGGIYSTACWDGSVPRASGLA